MTLVDDLRPGPVPPMDYLCTRDRNGNHTHWFNVRWNGTTPLYVCAANPAAALDIVNEWGVYPVSQGAIETVHGPAVRNSRWVTADTRTHCTPKKATR